MNNKKQLIIHGHFYQPPRENPWLNIIENQNSANPFKNWNSKINYECYSSNGEARVLNDKNKITKIINNFSYLSFNFGSTLLSWIEEYAPGTYNDILEADILSQKRCSGHGSAIAQVYNHIIMPLATEEDRQTQIIWGIKDFEYRFKRKPSGMWLSETAVDLNTLKLLALNGIKFTILSQNQAKEIRKLNSNGNWQNVSNNQIDPRQAYRCFWGTEVNDFIDIFFYDGPISRAIAFEELLKNGLTFLNRIENAFGADNLNKIRLVNLATDGESYGHHFQFGDMALAWLFDSLESNEEIALTNYAEFLKYNPPEYELKIYDNSSWSCAHGVERWRSNCGCKTGNSNWNQEWRTPLRDSLNYLSAALKDNFINECKNLINNPLNARNDYIDIVLNKYSEESKNNFLKKHQSKILNSEEQIKIFTLMESQLMALYMFTSCAWFFDDISGLEPIQVLKYALRAIELDKNFNKTDLSEQFLKILFQAKPNNPIYKNTEEIWQKEVLKSSLSYNEILSNYLAYRFFNTQINPFKYLNFAELLFQINKFQNATILLSKIELTDIKINYKNIYNCFAILNDTDFNIFILENTEEINEYLKELLIILKENKFNELDLLNKFKDKFKDSEIYTFNTLLEDIKSSIFKNINKNIYENFEKITENNFYNYELIINNLEKNKELGLIYQTINKLKIKEILNNKTINFNLLEKILNKNPQKYNLEKEVNDCIKNNFLDLYKNINYNYNFSLLNVFNILTIFNNLNYNFNLWENQNLWYKIKKNIYNNFNNEEKELFNNIGLKLDFMIK